MSDRPIIFSAPMVRALLAGRKTQTRRIVRKQPPIGARYTGIHYASDEPNGWFWNSPWGPFKTREAFMEDDRLWVRENWWSDFAAGGSEHGYLADGEPYSGNATVKRGSSMMMPRRLSRLTLTVTDVRVQRLQDIDDGDAISEGVLVERGATQGPPGQHGRPPPGLSPRHRFAELWNSLHGADAWSANPWVAALTFTVAHGNIDTLPSPSALSRAPAPCSGGVGGS